MSARVDWDAFYAALHERDFLPGYDVQDHLGGGAFGEVYRATKRSIGKPYAIKFLRLPEGSADAEQELEPVRLFASIDHPHLVTIEDMGVVRGVPYVLMGYAGEDTLARRIARGELEPEHAVRFFVQACRGVLALHDRRLAHFDLKPSNVFLRGEVARVGDYGLAKLLGDGGRASGPATGSRAGTGGTGGTPRYMAPEMFDGRPDHRADVYSLGLILYESLLARLPFDDEPPLVGSPTDAARELRRRLERPLPFPDAFPEPLRAVTARCLRSDPQERYHSLHELLEELGQTARQGDSIRVRYGSLSDELQELQRAGAPSPARRAPEAPSRSEPTSREDREATAMERDAGPATPDSGEPAAGPTSEPVPEEDRALDQRGSRRRAERSAPLDGLEGAKLDDEPPGAPLRGSTPSSTGASDVVDVQTLAETDPDAPDPAPGRSTSPLDSAWRRELRRARGEEPREPPPRLESGPATVPVPPRAEGGWFGSAVQTAVVGGEIMGALVTGPVVAATRGTTRWIDRALQGFHGVVGATLRFLLVLGLLAVLGGVVALAVLAALALKA